MASTLFPPAADGLSPCAGFRRHAANLLRGGMEAGVLVMVCLSPWAFGAAGAEFEFILYAGVAVLLSFWGARMLLEGQLSWRNCPVALCLAGLILAALWQLMPLPHGLLSRLSPSTARMLEQLLPSQAEVLPFGETREAPAPSAGSTLSFYPGRTRQDVIKLLAVLLLFAIVRNNTASPGSLRRLSVAALVNGACLSLFALLQFFTSPANLLYWTWPLAGTAFGPFVNRNHFAFYMNLCVGLSVGLLLSRQRVPEWGSESARFPRYHGYALTPSLSHSRTLLHDPATLWTIVALALMISSVAFCASRGGILGLLSGWTIFLLINWLRSVRFLRVGAVLLTLSLVLALLTWFGFGRVQARLSTLWGNEVFQEGRLHLWSRLLPLVKDFPVWGTGHGTFQYVEPLCRGDPADDDIYSNAENDYLEALIEGGLVRLVLSVLAIGLVFRLGYRAVCRDESPGAGGLAMGLLFGFTTMVVQSFVDFGLHIPAIALLATVLCAHLCAAGSGIRFQSCQPGPTRSESCSTADRPIEGRRQKVAAPGRERAGESSRLPERGQGDKDPGAGDVYSLRLWGLAPVAGAVLTVLFGLVLSYEGWRVYKVQELRLAASRLGALSDPASRPQQIDYLAAAARLAPESARVQVELALVHYDVYREQKQQLWIPGMLIDAAHAVCDLTPVQSPMLVVHSALTIAPGWVLSSVARKELSKVDERPLVRKYLVTPLRCLLQARDLCPLLPEPQRLIAENADQLEQADARITYLERAALLVPYDPGLWYVCGHELLDKQPDQACKKWRRSLELSDLYLFPILNESATRLGAREIRDQVLPDEPSILLAAALQLYPQPTAERQLFLDKALALLERQPGPVRAHDLHVKALIHCALGRSEEALAIYQAALEHEPRQVTWRFEFAQLLCQQRRLQESRRELLTVLYQQPEHTAARELLTIVERRIAEGM